MVCLYRDLIALRRNLHGTTRGLLGHHIEVLHVDDDRNVIAFRRWDSGGPGDDTVVVVNLAAEALEHYRVLFPQAGPWRLRLNSDAAVYGDDFGAHPSGDIVADESDDDGRPGADIAIGPYAVLIYSLSSDDDSHELASEHG